jgi:hypothetical protein
MKLKNAFKKDPPTTDPKLYLKKRPTGVQQLVAFPPLIYHSAALPDIMKLTKLNYKYMHL